jgi:hypothetical protein
MVDYRVELLGYYPQGELSLIQRYSNRCTQSDKASKTNGEDRQARLSISQYY